MGFHLTAVPPAAPTGLDVRWYAVAPADSVGAVAIDARPGLVALDGAGALVHPLLTGPDERFEPDAGWLVTQLGDAAAWTAAVGGPPTSSSTIAMLSWLHRSDGDAFAAMRRVATPHDWIAHRLTGEWVTTPEIAATTGFWSPTERRWRLDLLEIVGKDTDWEPMLPTVLDAP
jgi:sugar (pentulose or hexulose) kinase